MTSEQQLRTVCEEAGFLRTVAKGMYCKTGDDVDDGFGNFVESCREHTVSRTHPDSKAKLRIYNYMKIGLVLDVKVICHHNVYWIEIQIPSTVGDRTNVWVVISRSRNLDVDELRYRETEKHSWRSCSGMFAKNKRKNIPNVEGQKTTFLFFKEVQSMNTVADTLGKPKSRNLSVKWYDIMSIREIDRQMGQSIGN